MPPIMGAAIFIMAEFLSLPYVTIVFAAFLPALFYYVCLFMAVDFESAKLSLLGLPRHQLPKRRTSLIESWAFLLLLSFLIYLMVGLNFRAEKAAVISLVLLIILSMRRKGERMGGRKILAALNSGASSMVTIASTTATAGIILGIVDLTGIGFRLTVALSALGEHNLALLLIVAAIGAFILGMGLPTTPVYILGAVLMAPSIIKLGVPPLTAHLFIFYFGIIAQITPPVCITAYVTASIAKADPMRTGLTASKLGVISYVIPFVLIYSPQILLKGSVSSVVWVATCCLAGVVAIAAGVHSYFFGKIKCLQRILFLGIGFMLLFPWGGYNRIIGFALFAVVFLWNWWTNRKNKGNRLPSEW
jgi:TRAP transporter 4TM/12TM fusion protein